MPAAATAAAPAGRVGERGNWYLCANISLQRLQPGGKSLSAVLPVGAMVGGCNSVPLQGPVESTTRRASHFYLEQLPLLDRQFLHQRDP